MISGSSFSLFYAEQNSCLPWEENFEPLNVGSKFRCLAEQFGFPLHTKSLCSSTDYSNLKVYVCLLAPSSCGLRAFAFQPQRLALFLSSRLYLSLDSMFRQHRCSSFVGVLMRHLMLHDTLFGYFLVDADCS